MGKQNVNQGNSIALRLLDLRRHLNSCNICKSAISAEDFDLMCATAKASLVYAARRWNANIPARLAAKKSGEPYVYPCPNPNDHGAAYAIAAEPVIVSYVADRLM
jgi:hypothetical protein